MKILARVLKKVGALSLMFVFFLTSTTPLFALTEAEIAAREAQLRAEYDELQKDILKWQGVLAETRTKASTIEGDISSLNAKIREAEATISAKNRAIQQISGEIQNRDQKIVELEGRIERGRESLAQMIRKTYELDSYSTVEAMLTGRNLSDFFSDNDSFFAVKNAMQKTFAEIRGLKVETEQEKQVLGAKKDAETDAKVEVESSKQVIVKSETEKKQLLSLTKEEERAYAQVLADRQRQAAQIMAALFELRDTDGIPFGDAMRYAEVAEKATGVRAALVLAILTQESNLGKNQGSCLMTDPATGDGKGKNTGTFFEQVMKAPRDSVPFVAITERLGLDWRTTPVSCPPGHAYVPGRGFGGGMGPSQFIPSTWELFKGKIGAAFGISPNLANPWNPQHAIMATAIYMADLGAGSGNFTAERNAACRYYSGSACTPGRVPSNVFYGDQVMAKVKEIQDNIDFIDSV